MTGTADTEATEFHETYKLDVVAIPTNKPMVRDDHQDVVYKTEREKFTAVIAEILECHEKGQPVLVGTTSVEKSNAIAKLLKKKKIPHAVLNAKHHEREAFVVAQAGRKGAITVSTNMAGRGTDILLGGNPEMIAKLEFSEQGRDPDAEPEAFAEVVEKHDAACKAEGEEVRKLGGLHILGTERHESRRIDNQLRGRAGRQGDPGSSRFYLSLEDDLMRIFAGDRVKSLMERMGMPDDEPIEHPWVTQEHPGRAAQGRGAQLRHPQAPARIRRRHERAAQDGLQAPPAAPPRHLQAREARRRRQAHRQDARHQASIPRIADEVKRAIDRHGRSTTARRIARRTGEARRAEDDRGGRRDLLDDVAPAGHLPVLGLPLRLQGRATARSRRRSTSASSPRSR